MLGLRSRVVAPSLPCVRAALPARRGMRRQLLAVGGRSVVAHGPARRGAEARRRRSRAHLPRGLVRRLDVHRAHVSGVVSSHRRGEPRRRRRAAAQLGVLRGGRRSVRAGHLFDGRREPALQLRGAREASLRHLSTRRDVGPAAGREPRRGVEKLRASCRVHRGVAARPSARMRRADDRCPTRSRAVGPERRVRRAERHRSGTCADTTRDGWARGVRVRRGRARRAHPGDARRRAGVPFRHATIETQKDLLRW